MHAVNSIFTIVVNRSFINEETKLIVHMNMHMLLRLSHDNMQNFCTVIITI